MMINDLTARIGWNSNTIFGAVYNTFSIDPTPKLEIVFSGAQNTDSTTILSILYPTKDQVDDMITVLKNIKEQLPE